MVQLAQWGTALGLEDAMRVLFLEDFDPDTAEHGDQIVQPVLLFGETIGTLVKNGLLSRELVLDWIWVEGIWKRVEPAARRARDELDEPRLYENLELLASTGAPG
jgi:hypothetical protein